MSMVRAERVSVCVALEEGGTEKFKVSPGVTFGTIKKALWLKKGYSESEKIKKVFRLQNSEIYFGDNDLKLALGLRELFAEMKGEEKDINVVLYNRDDIGDKRKRKKRHPNSNVIVDPIIHKGYLKKRGAGITASYKKRFFVLQRQTLFYFSDERGFKHNKKANGIVSMGSCVGIPMANSEFDIKAEHLGTRSFHLIAPDQKSMMEWLGKIRTCCIRRTKTICALVINEMERRGELDIEGIFRVPGDNNEMNIIMKRFHNADYPDLKSVRNVHTLAGVLKACLRDLSEGEPLIPYSLAPMFIKIGTMENEQEAIAEIHVLLNKLDFSSRSLLLYLCGFLYKVSGFSARNLMPASNLGMVFGPNLVSRKDASPLDFANDQKSMQKVCSLLIKYFHKVFNPHLASPKALPEPFAPLVSPVRAPRPAALATPDSRPSIWAVHMRSSKLAPPPNLNENRGVVPSSIMPLTHKRQPTSNIFSTNDDIVDETSLRPPKKFNNLGSTQTGMDSIQEERVNEREVNETAAIGSEEQISLPFLNRTPSSPKDLRFYAAAKSQKMPRPVLALRQQCMDSFLEWERTLLQARTCMMEKWSVYSDKCASKAAIQTSKSAVISASAIDRSRFIGLSRFVEKHLRQQDEARQQLLKMYDELMVDEISSSEEEDHKADRKMKQKASAIKTDNERSSTQKLEFRPRTRVPPLSHQHSTSMPEPPPRAELESESPSPRLLPGQSISDIEPPPPTDSYSDEEEEDDVRREVRVRGSIVFAQAALQASKCTSKATCVDEKSPVVSGDPHSNYSRTRPSSIEKAPGGMQSKTVCVRRNQRRQLSITPMSRLSNVVKLPSLSQADDLGKLIITTNKVEYEKTEEQRKMKAAASLEAAKMARKKSLRNSRRSRFTQYKRVICTGGVRKEELTFEAGETINVTDNKDAKGKGWWKGFITCERKGWFPKGYVRVTT